MLSGNERERKIPVHKGSSFIIINFYSSHNRCFSPLLTKDFQPDNYVLKKYRGDSRARPVGPTKRRGNWDMEIGFIILLGHPCSINPFVKNLGKFSIFRLHFIMEATFSRPLVLGKLDVDYNSASFLPPLKKKERLFSYLMASIANSIIIKLLKGLHESLKFYLFFQLSYIANDRNQQNNIERRN